MRPQGLLAVGTYFRMASAWGFKRLAGTIPPGKGWPVAGFVIVRARPLDWQPADSSWLNGMKEKISRSVFGHWAALKLLERGVLCQPTAHRFDVLRLEPPLTIKEEEIDFTIAAVADVIGEYRGLPSLVKDVVERMGEQFVRGWEFR